LKSHKHQQPSEIIQDDFKQSMVDEGG